MKNGGFFFSFHFLQDHQFKNLILNKVIKYSSTVRWHMAGEILIAVIFVEFQRHIQQLCKIQVSLLANEEMGSVLVIFFFGVCIKFSLSFGFYTARQLDLRIGRN